MNKVKITVLKATLDQELAEEYGVEGLSACPMLRAGQTFTRIMRNRKAFATKPGKQSINMFFACTRRRKRLILLWGLDP